MRLAAVFAFLASLCFLTSCGPLPLARLGEAGARFTWKDSPGTRAIASQASRRAARAPYPTDPSLDPTLAYYGAIGNKVGSYTPTIVKFWILYVVAESDEPVMTGDYTSYTTNLSPFANPSSADDYTNGYMDQFYADFTNPDITFTPPMGVPTGHTYKNLILQLMGGMADMGFNQLSGTFNPRPEVVVDLPGYEGVFTTPAHASEGLLVPGDSNGSTYAFYPANLVPGNWTGSDGPAWTPGTDPLNGVSLLIMFTGDTYGVTGPQMQIPTTWILGDYHALVIPYDNNTPGDKSDDIVVFAPRWWERINLVPEVVQ